MDIKALENRIIELKGEQSSIMKKKRNARDLDALKTIRAELNKLKKEAKSHYRRK